MSPAELTFGKSMIGSTQSLSVVLSNKGSEILPYSLSGLSDPFSTTITSGTVAVGADLSIPVVFAPSAVESYSGEMVISFPGTDLENIIVPITGAGTDNICDGSDESDCLPVWGYWFDQAQINQMLYPASKLGALKGKKLTKLTFYPKNGINFYSNSNNNSTVIIKLANVSSGTTFTYPLEPEKTTVKSITLPTSAQDNLTEWVFEFDDTFDYTGGDLLVEVVTTTGKFGASTFYGENQSVTSSYYKRSGATAAASNFLPKVTFAYDDSGIPAPTYTMEVTSSKTVDCGTIIGSGNTTATQKLVVKNTGNQAIMPVITLSGDNAGKFSFTPAEVTELAADATREYTFTFTAANGDAEGEYTANATIADQNGNATAINDVTVKGTVVAATISGTVSPAELTFEAFVNGSATQTITIENTGNVPFTPVFSTLSAPFSIEDATEIAAGTSKEFVVTYAPDEVGSQHNATFSVTIGAQEPITVTLNGTAINGGEITVADGTSTNEIVPIWGTYLTSYNTKITGQMIYPVSELSELPQYAKIKGIKFYAWSAIPDKVSGRTMVVRVGNTTDENVSKTTLSGRSLLSSENKVYIGTPIVSDKEMSFTFTGDGVEWNGSNLAIEIYVAQGTGSNDNEVYWYGKAIGSSGGYRYTNKDNYGPSTGEQTFLPKMTIIYEAASTDPIIEVDNNALDFNTLVGSSTTKTVAVTGKNLTGDITVTIAGEGFIVNPETLSSTGGELNVTYSPTSPATAETPHTAIITLSSTGAEDVVVNLSGTAEDPVASGAVTPTELTFETYENVAATKVITVENTGNIAFTPTFTISAPFSIEDATEIAVGESKDFTVTYEPTAVGTHTATLIIGISGTTIEVALSGIVTVAPYEITVAKGNTKTNVAPISTSYVDEAGTYTTMIYPKEMLNRKGLVGKKIRGIRFYPNDPIPTTFTVGSLNVFVGESEMTTITNAEEASAAVAEATLVKTLSVEDGLEVVEIMFNDKYNYNGENLVIKTLVEEIGNWNFNYFIGESQDHKCVYSNKTMPDGTDRILPQVTFIVDEPEVEEISFVDLCTTGVKGHVYTITDELTSVYQNGTSVWFKDNNNSIVKDVPAEGDMDFEVEGVSQMAFDQSNWIEVIFDDEETAEQYNIQPMLVGGIKGTYIDNVNPTLVLNNRGVELTENGVETAYTPNPYIPANFLGSQDCQSGQGHGHFFFAKPKVQEYATIMFAMYDGNNIMKMYSGEGAGNGHKFQGQFTIDLSENDTQDVKLTEGVVYSNFNAIIRKVSAQNAPGLKAGGDATYVVYPQNLKGSNGLPTAINGIVYGKDVKSVKYVNVAGMVSDRPFQGVNIVVTEFSDGSSTTTKVVR